MVQLGRKHVAAPYLLGIAWILSHPIISVITGELKCRGIYIDEHQLDPHAYDTSTASTRTASSRSNDSGRGSRYLDGGGSSEVSSPAAAALKSLLDGAYGYPSLDLFNSNTTGGAISGEDSSSAPNANNASNAKRAQSRQKITAAFHENYHHSILEGIKSTLADPYKNDRREVCDIIHSILHHGIPFHFRSGRSNHDFNPSNVLLYKLASMLSSPALSCQPSPHFNIVNLQPVQAPTAPLETIVLVIPAVMQNHHNSLLLQNQVLFMIARIIEHSLPFLAKSFLFVFCNHDIPTDTCVDHFMLANGVHRPTQNTSSTTLSTSTTSTTTQKHQPSFHNTKYLIRQLIVLDIQTTTTNTPIMQVSNDQSTFAFQIIPQGQFGQLPNLDFLTAALYSFQQVGIHKIIPNLQHSHRQSYIDSITLHPFHSFTTWWKQNVVQTYFPQTPWWQTYGNDLANMFSFMINSVLRSAPHAKALNHGIDSLTIRIEIASQNQIDSSILEKRINHILYGLEHLFRAINSLQELLHHNVNQYIMVSATKFVSFDEYIIPTILILLPLVLRIVMIIHALRSQGSSPKQLTNAEEESKGLRLQLWICLLALYILVPIALVHVSLGLISAILLVPLLSFA